MTQNMEGIIALDRLRDHYKHCIRLSASNKINPKNAFDLQLIDYMQDLVSRTEDGQMNFKIASSALDVGAKIYSSRVDCIQSEAQKVASSILMALDGQKTDKQGENPDDTQDDNNLSGGSDRLDDGDDGENARAKASRKKTRKNVKTVVEDETMLDAKLEQLVLGDPFLDGLSRDYDMSCPAALISYNALTQPNCLLTVESNNMRRNYKEDSNSTPTNSLNCVTLITKNLNCAQIIRNNLTNQICPRLQNFLFNDRTTTISGLNTILDETIEQAPVLNSTKAMPGGAHEFDPEQYDDGVGHDSYSDAGNDAGLMDANDENDLIPNLDKIAASKPSEYGYSTEHHRLLNTWAGPFAWKVAKAPQTAKKDGAPKSTRKRMKLEQLPINFAEGELKINELVSKKTIRHSTDVLRKWRKKLYRPQDHNYTEELTREIIEHTFLKLEDTYHNAKAQLDAQKAKDNHEYENHNGLDGETHSPDLGGFDDVHDDSDDEFRADPVDNGNEVGLGAPLNASMTQQNDLEFAGEHLIEQPYTVAQVVIPFAKIAKKMDVRKLKHVMWDLLLPPENNKTAATTAQENSVQNQDNATVVENNHLTSVGGDQTTVVEATVTKKTPSPTPSESAVHLSFSNLYGELPVRVSSKMANDLSQPIAFVTLLHLANEKNLKLIPEQDLKDFVIEQDQLV